jgi:glycosyltransferase involved in cell wall biosynthesis
MDRITRTRVTPGHDSHRSAEIKLSVVVPLMNEQESVEPLLRQLAQALLPLHSRSARKSDEAEAVLTNHDEQGWPRLVLDSVGEGCEIILVDDGSQDRTYEHAVQASRISPIPVRVISLQRNFGQTAAMQAGIDAARGRLIATLDGDLQNDPADIPIMIERLEADDLDLLVGRRRCRQDGMLLRLIPSWIANRLIARVTGVKISDYGCSLKIYRADVIRQVRLQGEMHRFIPAWVALVTQPSRIGEMDVRHRARQFGKSKYGISRAIRVILDLMSVLFFMRFRARPGHFFGTVGIVIGAVGLAMLAMLFVDKYLFGEDIGSRPMLIIGALAVMSSVQFICFGIMAEMLSRIYHESSTRSTYVVRQVHDNHQVADESSDPNPSECSSIRAVG